MESRLPIESLSQAPSPNGIERTSKAMRFPVAVPDGTIGGVGCINVDVTEERARSARTAHLAAIVEGTEDAIWSVDLARTAPGVESVVDTNRCIAAAHAFIEESLPDDVESCLELGVGAWPVHASETELEAAVVNLALNARSAMPETGRLEIKTANLHLDGAAVKRGLTPGRYVRITVSDTGTGMTPEVSDRAFEPFFSTKDKGEGSGLGLARVFRFARQSGGDVVIQSKPGEGTTVRLYLPAAPADSDPGSAPTQTRPR